MAADPRGQRAHVRAKQAEIAADRRDCAWQLNGAEDGLIHLNTLPSGFTQKVREGEGSVPRAQVTSQGDLCKVWPGYTAGTRHNLGMKPPCHVGRGQRALARNWREDIVPLKISFSTHDSR